MEQIVKVLYEVAAEGSVPSLLDLLNKDRFILDRCTAISYGETPLHIAAMFGHLEFCKELLKRKPELAEELDCRRSSALHLASAKGFTDIVKALASVGPKMIFAYDEDGKTPIHVAAMKGRVEVLKELMNIEPDAAHRRVHMCQGETVMHLCVQYNQLEALKFLVENINDEELLNAKDDNGNSILHLAVSDKQVQIVKYLVENTKIDVKALNSKGLTTIEILDQTRRDSKYIDIAHCLHHYASQSSNRIPSSPGQVAKYQNSSKSKREKKASNLNKSASTLDKRTWLEGQLSALMVVASLLATVGFQAALTPPGGFWQEDVPIKNSTIIKNETALTPAGDVLYEAGHSIFADKHESAYKEFMICNTVGFIFSLSVILLLVSGLPCTTRKVFMWILRVTMWTSITVMGYTYSLVVMAPLRPSPDKEKETTSNSATKKVADILTKVIVGWLLLMALMNMVHTIRLLSKIIRRWNPKIGNSKLWRVIRILIAILWILITSGALFIIIIGVDFFSEKEYVLSVKVLLVVIILGLPLLAVLLVMALWGVAHIIIKEFRRIKKAMTNSRSQDSIIVV